VDVRRQLTRIAAAQHGLITADQARLGGLGPGQIRWLTGSGRWIPLRPGVYAVAGSPPTRMQQVVATTLCLQPGAWLSHSTAGWLWGLRDVDAEQIEVVTALDRRVGLDGVVGHRSGCLYSADVTSQARVPLTSPERTVVDLSARLTPAALGRTVDDAIRRRVVRLERLRRCADRLVSGPGRRMDVVHGLLAERLPGYDPGDSDLETRVLRLIVRNGLPVPVQQHRVRTGGRTFRIDLAYPDLRLAIELDGWAYHNTRTAFDDDRARANLLVADGWTVVRFTSRSTEREIVTCIEATRRATRRPFGKSSAA
jgi:very-short-patch-repair endonuclease